MKVGQKYSHLNGEEFLLVHRKSLYDEILEVIEKIDADLFKTKLSKEKTKSGEYLYSPIEMNKEFRKLFWVKGWEEDRYSYYITLNREHMEKTIQMTTTEQKQYLEKQKEIEPIFSYNQTDFVKDKIAVEVQFGKYPFVAYDLFVKHMLFYTGNKIDLGIEILPTKVLQKQMSSGVAYFEKEVYNLMRQGRTSPPVPLLILGVEP